MSPALSPEQSAFIWATLDGINRAPKYCLIPLRNDNNTYQQTVDAIWYIIQNRLDEWLLFNVEFYNPAMGVQQNGNLYVATHIRKRPIVAQEILDDINRTLRCGAKLTPQLQIVKKSCEDKIKSLSSRYSKEGSQSESLKSNNIMAKTARKPSVNTTEPTVNNPQSQNTTSPPAATQTGEPSAIAAVVVKDKSEIIRAQFLSVKALIQEDVKKIATYKVITTAEEAKGLQDLMLNLKDKKNVVDKVHKIGKAPSLAEGKMWDAAKNELNDDLVEAALTESKNKLHAWDILRREEEAKKQQAADIERKKLDDQAAAEATRISNIKVELDAFEQNIAKKIIEAPTAIALGNIWTQDLAPFIPSEQAHGVFAQHAHEMKGRLELLGKACHAKIQAKDEFTAGRIPSAVRDEIIEKSDVTIRGYSFEYGKAMEQIAIVETAAVEEATVASEIAKSTITGQQIMEQSKPMLNYRRQWRWEVVDKEAIGSPVKIMQQLQQLYIQVDGKFVPAYVMPSFTEMFTLDTEKIKGFIESTNASENPLFNGEIVDGIAFYVEETAVMPRS